MRSRSSAVALIAVWGAFAARAASPGWRAVLESAGLDAVERLHVAAGEPARDWVREVRQGAYLIVEGDGEAARAFGFRAGPKRLRVRSVRDEHNPRLPVIWEREADLPVFEMPPGARVFAWERWSSSPLLAGLRQGNGAVLWAAAPPGESGYERFPYIVHALRDLGLEPPFHSRRLWAFFDSSYRMRADPAWFAARWRESGIAALHVAAWHYFEPDPARDGYLRALIRECRRRGILIYAWLELPHVSEEFWRKHPEWREKTAVLQDAHLDWRRLMNLANPECRKAVAEGLRGLLGRFDWDGVNLAELYFESLEGAANPVRFTPMNGDVRREFERAAGFDPVDLFRPGAPANPRGLRAFLDYRTALARRIETEWVEEIARIAPGLDLVLTHVDDRLDPAMRDAIGADTGALLKSLNGRALTFMVEDPATVWHFGPQRYPEIARRYQPLGAGTSRLAVDINVVERYQDVYPTKQQTGVELLRLVRLASGAFPRVALYSENSIPACDLPLLPAASAPAGQLREEGDALTVDLPAPAGVRWTGPARVDGKPWPALDGSFVWLPAGKHRLEHDEESPPLRLLDLNGDLRSASALPGGFVFSYSNPSRTLAVLDRTPERVEIDGAETKAELAGPATLVLPAGRHEVRVF